MRKIKVLRGKEASQKKVAIEPGEIAPVVLENFETLTNPPFKPKLELIEADPHNPPDMNTNTDQNIKTDGEDSNRPSAEDVARKAPEYENSNSVEKENIPHENEHVKQGAKEEDSEEVEEEQDETSTIEARMADYTTKYTLATQLFDIRLAAGLEQEINRYNFPTKKAEEETVEMLQKQVNDSEAFLKQIQASQQEKTANRNVLLPSGFTNAASGSKGPFNEDIEIVLGG